MMSLLKNCFIRCFNGSSKWYGTLLGFCVTGLASDFNGRWISMSFPSRCALSALVLFAFKDVIVEASSRLGSRSSPSASNCIILRSSYVCRLSRGRESMFPLIITNVVLMLRALLAMHMVT